MEEACWESFLLFGGGYIFEQSVQSCDRRLEGWMLLSVRGSRCWLSLKIWPTWSTTARTVPTASWSKADWLKADEEYLALRRVCAKQLRSLALSGRVRDSRNVSSLISMDCRKAIHRLHDISHYLSVSPVIEALQAFSAITHRETIGNLVTVEELKKTVKLIWDTGEKQVSLFFIC